MVGGWGFLVVGGAGGRGCEGTHFLVGVFALFFWMEELGGGCVGGWEVAERCYCWGRRTVEGRLTLRLRCLPKDGARTSGSLNKGNVGTSSSRSVGEE